MRISLATLAALVFIASQSQFAQGAGRAGAPDTARTTSPGRDSITAVLEYVVLDDGTSIIGTATSEDSTTITFTMPSGATTRVPRSVIKDRMRAVVDGDGKVVHLDPNRTRLLFSPTGRPLKAGQGYFSISEVFFPMVCVGFTDYLSIAGGVSIIPYADNQLMYFNVKITPMTSENGWLSAGVLYVVPPNFEYGGVGLAYAIGTYGTERDALTLGLGFGFADGEFLDAPAIMVGAETQISNSVKLLTENYFFPAGGGGLLSLGLRIFGANLAGDIGLFSFTESFGFPVPWLGLAYNFGG